MPEWLRRLNEWLALGLAVIAVITLVAGTQWLDATRSWVYANAPGAIATTLRSIGWAIHSVIEPYRQLMNWLVGFLPIKVPEHIAVLLPPVISIGGNSVTSWIYTRITRRRIKRIEELLQRYNKLLEERTELSEENLEGKTISERAEVLKEAKKRIVQNDDAIGDLNLAVEIARDAVNNAKRWLYRAIVLLAIYSAVFLIEDIYLRL